MMRTGAHCAPADAPFSDAGAWCDALSARFLTADADASVVAAAMAALTALLLMPSQSHALRDRHARLLPPLAALAARADADADADAAYEVAYALAKLHHASAAKLRCSAALLRVLQVTPGALAGLLRGAAAALGEDDAGAARVRAMLACLCGQLAWHEAHAALLFHSGFAAATLLQLLPASAPASALGGSSNGMGTIASQWALPPEEVLRALLAEEEAKEPGDADDTAKAPAAAAQCALLSCGAGAGNAERASWLLCAAQRLLPALLRAGLRAVTAAPEAEDAHTQKIIFAALSALARAAQPDDDDEATSDDDNLPGPWHRDQEAEDDDGVHGVGLTVGGRPLENAADARSLLRANNMLLGLRDMAAASGAAAAALPPFPFAPPRGAPDAHALVKLAAAHVARGALRVPEGAAGGAHLLALWLLANWLALPHTPASCVARLAPLLRRDACLAVDVIERAAGVAQGQRLALAAALAALELAASDARPLAALAAAFAHAPRAAVEATLIAPLCAALKKGLRARTRWEVLRM
jgi:hypothetical protein